MSCQLLFVLFTIAHTLTGAVRICNPHAFQHLSQYHLHQGGMSAVSIYKHRRTEQIYIRKLIPKQLKPGRSERGQWNSFKTEVAALEHLKHSTISPKLYCIRDSPGMNLTEYTEKAGRVYLMMEVIPGLNMAQVIKTQRSPTFLKRILKKIARCLFILHNMGITHLDIKPDNIIVLAQSGDVKLIDYGGVYSETLHLTSGYFHKTPLYQHPALRSISDATPIMDWYSFGATAYYSRQAQLYPGKTLADIGPVNSSSLPEQESELRELIDHCTGDVDLRTPSNSFYEEMLLLPYFVGKKRVP